MITGILLAAGESSRFGADKLLYPMMDRAPLAIAALRNLKRGVDDVLAVIRPDQRELTTWLVAEGARVIKCADADRGMGVSLACGVRASVAADGWLVALADMPRIRPATVARIADALRAGLLIVAPAHTGKRGHPVGFAAMFRDELTALNGDAGARALLDRHADLVNLIECQDAGVLVDVDKPIDLETIQAHRPAAEESPGATPGEKIVTIT